VTGSAGSLRVHRTAMEITVDGETERHEFEGFNGVEWELAAFAESIRKGAPHLNTPEAALADLKLVESMLQAAETGKTVRLT
jgi:predicted dehydrogenase